MTAAAIIQAASADGVRLALTPAGTLKVKGPQPAVSRWDGPLRQHKPEIIRLLAQAANDPAAVSLDTTQERQIRHWLALIGEDDPYTIREVIDACRRDAEVLAYFVGRAAELHQVETDQAAHQVAHSCRSCRHRATPGRSDPGYCVARADLPAAYGQHHPLRHLPADRGASCTRFEPGD